MKKRHTFKCWNTDCQRIYTLYLEFTKDQVLIVGCPYCNSEGVVDLKPYPSKKEICRGEGETEQETEVLQLPDIIITQQPEKSGE